MLEEISKGIFFWKCAKYKFEFLHNQTIFVKNIFFFWKSHHNTLSKKKDFFFTHSHWQAGPPKLVHKTGCWKLQFMGPVIHAIKLSLSTKKIFFCEFIILRGLLKKIIDYFFYFALTFFTIVKKKLKLPKFLPKIKFSPHVLLLKISAIKRVVNFHHTFYCWKICAILSQGEVYPV